MGQHDSNVVTGGMKYLHELSSDFGMELPKEIRRLDGLNQWSIPHSMYRIQHGVSPKLPRSAHVGNSLRIAEIVLNSTPELSDYSKTRIRGEVFAHDVNTTSGSPHLDREEEGRDALLDLITGQNTFRNSQLPYFIAKVFCDPEGIAEEIEKGQDSMIHRTAQGIENLEHIITDAIPPISDEVRRRIISGARIDLETGGLLLSPSVYIGGLGISDFLGKNRKNVLDAYTDANTAGLYYEAILLRMRDRLIEMMDDTFVIYRTDDHELYRMLSGMGNLDWAQKAALFILKERELPDITHDYSPLFFKHVRMQTSDRSVPSQYRQFREGLGRKDFEKKLFGDEPVQVMAFANHVKPEHITVRNRYDFPGMVQITLAVYHMPSMPTRLTEREIREKLSSDTYFGPILKS